MNSFKPTTHPANISDYRMSSYIIPGVNKMSTCKFININNEKSIQVWFSLVLMSSDKTNYNWAAPQNILRARQKNKRRREIPSYNKKETILYIVKK